MAERKSKKLKKGTCRHCGHPIALVDGIWVHEDVDEDPKQEDYGWVRCLPYDHIGPNSSAEPEIVLETLADLRRELKAIGFRVTTESLSWGRHATYRAPDGTGLTFNVFTSAQLATWEPLLDWLRENKAALCALGKREKIYGLTK